MRLPLASCAGHGPLQIEQPVELAAQIKSFCDKPLMAWVTYSTPALVVADRQSGGGPRGGRSATALANAIAW